MKKILLTRLLPIVALVMLFNQSCTNLDEQLYSEVLADDFFSTDEEFDSALGTAYATLFNHIGEYHGLQEVSSDQVVVPTRGQDWDDGGNWRALHLHTYGPSTDRVRGTWPLLYAGVNTCNRLIQQFEASGNQNAVKFISELKVLRALYYLFLVDTYGNVPLVTEFKEGDQPGNTPRAQVYDFIESEVTANIANLSKNVDQSTYARINFFAAQAILAKLFLNAEVYSGTAQWQKALDATNAIIESDLYAMEVDFFAAFSSRNDQSSENIFVIPYDAVFGGGFNLHQRTLHYAQQNEFDMQEQPWNGYSSMQEYYNSFESDDARLGQFIVGPRFSSKGERLTDADVESNDPDGAPLTLTPEINELGPSALRQAGARIGKWEIPLGSTRDLSNDFAIFRYADILLTKAEALLRLNQDLGVALEMVNLVRRRAGASEWSMGDLTLDNLLAERGRELAFEAWRRTDQIRFGTYNDAWEFKDADPSDHVNIFPIPQNQLDANPNLQQNPGY